MEKSNDIDLEVQDHEHDHHNLTNETIENHDHDNTEAPCGRLDYQNVEQYDGTLGVSREFVNTHQAPVGQTQWNNNISEKYTNPGDVSGERWCTGTLIFDDLFLTAGHCFDSKAGRWTIPCINGTDTPIPPKEIATNMHVNFNYQVDPEGNQRTEQSFQILELVEYREGPEKLDFAIVRLDGNPGKIFGYTKISNVDAQVNDMVCIIQHPNEESKKIEAGPIVSLNGNHIEYNDIDTSSGSSGAGVLLSPDGTLVGLHTNGQCDREEGKNYGVRISVLLNVSPTLRMVAAQQ